MTGPAEPSYVRGGLGRGAHSPGVAAVRAVDHRDWSGHRPRGSPPSTPSRPGRRSGWPWRCSGAWLRRRRASGCGPGGAGGVGGSSDRAATRAAAGDVGDGARRTRQAVVVVLSNDRVTAPLRPAPIAVPDADLDDLRDRLRRPAGRSRRRSTTGRRACRWPTCRSCARTGPTSYDWRRARGRAQRLRPATLHATRRRRPRHPLPARPLAASPAPCRSCSPTAGRARSSSSSRSSARSPTPRPTAATPADAFHVVCPSLPGYGFSDKPTAHRLGRRAHRRRVGGADGPARLRPLRRPGRRLGLVGHDAASAAQHPDHCVGIHLNMPSSPRARRDRATSPRPSSAALGRSSDHRKWGIGLLEAAVAPGRRRSATAWSTRRPAQAAWIVEKFWAWTDCDGHPENALTRDELLDNVMLYWLPGRRRVVGPPLLGELRPLPARATGRPCRPGMSIFPKEIFRPSRRWAERRFTDIRHWNELDRGGHFAAFEQPDAVRRRGPHVLPPRALTPGAPPVGADQVVEPCDPWANPGGSNTGPSKRSVVVNVATSSRRSLVLWRSGTPRKIVATRAWCSGRCRSARRRSPPATGTSSSRRPGRGAGRQEDAPAERVDRAPPVIGHPVELAVHQGDLVADRRPRRARPARARSYVRRSLSACAHDVRLVVVDALNGVIPS